uniref:BSD domain-containing protein n=1 Tax=Meloidogyne incognita TaxID=6306 RepID=A0A914LZL5_MELIC
MSTFFSNIKSTIANVENKIASFNKKEEECEIQKSEENVEKMTEENEEIKKEEEEEEEKSSSKPSLFANKMFGMAIKASTKIQEEAKNFTPLKIIGNFEKERQKFIDELESEKRTKMEDSSQLCLLLDNLEAKRHIISISSDTKNFTEDLPISSDIGIEIEEIKTNAKEFFKLDPRLEDVRFELVPKRITEAKFWQNYAYKLSLVKKVLGDKPPVVEPKTAQNIQEEAKPSAIDGKEQVKESTTNLEQEEDDSLEKDLFEDFDEFEVVNGNCGNGSKKEEDENKLIVDDELNDEINALLEGDK